MARWYNCRAVKKILLAAIFLIALLSAGFIYRNAVEHPSKPIVCPLDAQLCPDGTSVSRIGPSCTFPQCPPPNISFQNIGLSFAIPEGFAEIPPPDAASIAAYALTNASSTQASSTLPVAEIVVRRYAVDASSTPLLVIRATAIGGASGMPLPVTAFSSSVLGARRFTVATIERFEGVIDTAYYFARGSDVIRFDALDRNVVNWTDPSLDRSALPAERALRTLLSGLQVE